MGNISRIRKRISPKIAMASAHIEVNGCQVFLGHPNEGKALSSARDFKAMLAKVIMRSRRPNLGDFYTAHFQLLDRIKEGRAIWN